MADSTDARHGSQPGGAAGRGGDQGGRTVGTHGAGLGDACAFAARVGDFTCDDPRWRKRLRSAPASGTRSCGARELDGPPRLAPTIARPPRGDSPHGRHRAAAVRRLPTRSRPTLDRAGRCLPPGLAIELTFELRTAGGRQRARLRRRGNAGPAGPRHVGRRRPGRRLHRVPDRQGADRPGPGPEHFDRFKVADRRRPLLRGRRWSASSATTRRPTGGASDRGTTARRCSGGSRPRSDPAVDGGRCDARPRERAAHLRRARRRPASTCCGRSNSPHGCGRRSTSPTSSRPATTRLACWPLLSRRTRTHIHIKDATAPTGIVVPAGAGASGHARRRSSPSAYADGYRGFLSLEPHLAAAGPVPRVQRAGPCFSRRLRPCAIRVPSAHRVGGGGVGLRVTDGAHCLQRDARRSRRRTRSVAGRRRPGRTAPTSPPSWRPSPPART